MKTVKTSRALALGVTAALAATAFPFTSASAALPTPDSLVASSQDGAFFQPSDYAAGDITVQALAGTDATDVDDSQDLTFTWTVEQFGPSGTTDVLPAAEQKTDVDGKFVVALPADKGAGRYTLKAGLGADGQGDGEVPAANLLTVSVGNASAVDGSTAKIVVAGASTPGLAENGTLTVTTPDGVDVGTAPDPVVGQVYTLTVDHGFFTTGEPTTTVKGAQAGNLPSSGTRFTGITDANGTLRFQTGIARDTGFDDDGIVTAKVSVVNGPSAAQTTTWNSGTEDDPPLNGQVAIKTSPTSAQLNPVEPTLAGDQTYYDVFALDQFGNPVGGMTIDLDSVGPRKSVEADAGSIDTNFDNGGDFSVVSTVADRVTTTATWFAAPSYVYQDTKGAASDVPFEDRGDVFASISSSFYEIDFNASRYSMSSSVSDTVRVGTTVTQTVRAVDQQGNPIEGFQVRFLRFGPDATNGDVVATKTTNALGEATYSFIGTRRGRATITAEITDGNRRRELNGSAAFGVAVNARLARTKGVSSGGRLDRLTVSATKVAAGARVNLYKVVKGKQKLVGSKKLGRKGTVAFAIRDRNRNAKTKYVARMRSTSTSMADQSRTVNVR